MTIMGIDPGFALMGYGVIEKNGQRLTPIDCGVIQTPAGMRNSLRLKLLYENLCKLISHFKPDAIAVEELFYHTNAKTVITVGQARGVILLAAEMCNVPLYEYTPLQVKQAVVGYGRAEKHQIQQMVKVMPNLAAVPKPDDAADAMAIAITHANSVAMLNKTEGN